MLLLSARCRVVAVRVGLSPSYSVVRGVFVPLGSRGIGVGAGTKYVKRVSCDRCVRVGRIPACAATSRPACLFSCALKSTCCLERHRVSCVAYLPDGILSFYDAISPRVAHAARATPRRSL
ncbi:hypothetical protein LguiB_036330 [Lonicera macranthoides]